MSYLDRDMLGLGEKLFAVPWEKLTLDTVNKRFLPDVDKEQLKSAPGFGQDNWPDMASEAWNHQMEAFYGSGTRYGSAAGRMADDGLSRSGRSDLRGQRPRVIRQHCWPHRQQPTCRRHRSVGLHVAMPR